MKSLAILGASGHGKVVADCAELCGWQAVVFFDDAWPSLEANSHWPVRGDTQSLIDSLDHFDGVIVAIGDCAVRFERVVMLRQAGARLVSLVHPSAVVSRYASIGEATVIFAGAVVNADAGIGNGVIINTMASVDHDCMLSDGVHVSPGVNLAGGVCIGERAWVGMGASVMQKVVVGADAIVGSGAVVICDVTPSFTVVGVPARPLMV